MPTDTRTTVDERSSGSAEERSSIWIAIVVLAPLAALCCRPLLPAGWYASHEGLRPLARALAAYHEVAAGDLYPRWVSTAYLGKGAPLFDFYPPAFSLLVAWGHGLGIPFLLWTKLLVLLLFLGGALGAYLWTRPHLGHHAALVAAVLYLCAPYHFVDLYVRGATAEFTSLAALPYLFLGIDRVVARRSAGSLSLLAFAGASVVLSHFLGALMIAPFAVTWALARAARSGAFWRVLAGVAAGAALAAALSAYYWLPALVERDALSAGRLARSAEGYYSPILHFVRPAQWLDPAWGFGASLPDGYADGMSFQIGLLTAAAVAASVLLARALDGPARRAVHLALGLGLAGLYLTSAAARPLYAGVAPLRMVQFPWRFLGPVTLFASLAGAGFARVLAGRHRLLGPAAAAGIAALALALSTAQRAVEAPIPFADDVAEIDAAVAADPWVAKFGNEDEFLPRDADVASALTLRGGATLGGLRVKTEFVQARRLDVTFGVSAPDGEGVAYVPWHQFPGWKVVLDGREWSFVPGPAGILAFRVPEGSHVARVYFGTTPVRVAGWTLAALGLVALAALALRERAAARGREAQGREDGA